jgi:hypothetical protein
MPAFLRLQHNFGRASRLVLIPRRLGAPHVDVVVMAARDPSTADRALGIRERALRWGRSRTMIVPCRACLARSRGNFEWFLSRRFLQLVRGFIVSVSFSSPRGNSLDFNFNAGSGLI